MCKTAERNSCIRVGLNTEPRFHGVLLFIIKIRLGIKVIPALAWFFAPHCQNKRMKKLYSMAMLAAGLLWITACGNNSGSGNQDTGSGNRDSSSNVVTPPDNSSATNPSMADTAYPRKDSANGNMNRKDSGSMKH